MRIEIDLRKVERGTHIGQVKVTRGGKTFYRKQRVGRKEKSQEVFKPSWRDKPEGYFNSDDATSVPVHFKLRSGPIAHIGYYNNERSIILGKRFFEYSNEDFGEEYESKLIAHETGHVFSHQIKNLEEELLGGCAGDVLGTLVKDPDGHVSYEGLWYMENSSESFAESVAILYTDPKMFKDKHPEAYEFVKSVLPNNWKEIVKANIKSMLDVKEEYMLSYGE